MHQRDSNEILNTKYFQKIIYIVTFKPIDKKVTQVVFDEWKLLC